MIKNYVFIYFNPIHSEQGLGLGVLQWTYILKGGPDRKKLGNHWLTLKWGTSSVVILSVLAC